MKKNNCKYCGGLFKVATTEYTIRSRHSQKSETTIENLVVNECTICGHVEMPESSEKYIEMIRQKIRREMEGETNEAKVTSMISKPEVNPLDIHLKNFKNIIKKLIG